MQQCNFVYANLAVNDSHISSAELFRTWEQLQRMELHDMSLTHTILKRTSRSDAVLHRSLVVLGNVTSLFTPASETLINDVWFDLAK